MSGENRSRGFIDRASKRAQFVLSDSGESTRLIDFYVAYSTRRDVLWRGDSMSEITALTMISKVAQFAPLCLAATGEPGQSC